MAFRLTAWLQETCETQLLLGNHWQQEKNRHKHTQDIAGARLDPERAWEGLYHDNGSCLEIANDIHPDSNSYLIITKLAPLEVTDGHTLLRAHISPTCSTYLHQRANPDDVILVHKYIIRYTSYGPPSLKLQFVLQDVDWIGDKSAVLLQPSSNELQPLWSEAILAVLCRLHETRAAQDDRCLGSAFRTSERAANISAAMGTADEGSQSASQAHTQHTFGTQVPFQTRPRPSVDDPQLLSVKRLEPVLAGNTQREELRPTAAMVLGLLGRGQNSGPSKVNSNPTTKSPRRAQDRPQKPTDPPATQMQTQLPTHINRQPTQTQTVKAATAVLSPRGQPSPRPKQVVDLESASHRLSKSPRQHAESVNVARKSENNHLQRLASECAWMQDMEFTREALKVPFDQMSLLRNDGSWHKPLPGHRFPDGNVPIVILTTLHRLADETAAMEAGPDSDEEMDEDPSPEFPIASLDPTQDSALEPTQDDKTASSQVSWSQSPSPEPPKLLTRSNPQLPPDSSFEVAQVPDDNTIKDVIKLPQSQPPIFIESSNESDDNEQNGPPSSPPVIIDDDLEMEEYVPQGLGEDSMAGANEVEPLRAPSVSPPPRPVVHVKDTPYAKGKNGHRDAEHFSPKSTREQKPHGSSNQTSSTSVIHGTYNDKTSLKTQPQAVVSRSRKSVVGTADNERPPRKEHSPKDSPEGSKILAIDQASRAAVHDPVNQEIIDAPHQQNNVQSDLQSTRISVELIDEPQLLQKLTHIPAGVPSNSPEMLVAHSPSQSRDSDDVKEIWEKSVLSESPSLKLGAVKRKHTDSPSKKQRVHSHRRKIKGVSFGDDSPVSEDPGPALQRYREESLRKFREARDSSASLEHRHQSAGRANSSGRDDAMEIDSPNAFKDDQSAPNMSPRHESLYEEPNRTSSQATRASQAPPSASRHGNGPMLYARLAEHGPSNTETTNKALSNVFLTFKAAYPEYTGDTKHFQGQCMQMIQLDEEDKMVPKWQWDDYIIRNRTDFKDYALQCVDQGENPEPYHRFYKDTIRDTLYRKGVIESKATLLQALQQLNDGPPSYGSENIAKTILRKPKRSRASLPSAFDQPKDALKRVNVLSNKKPRHSLPAKPQDNHQTPLKDLHSNQVGTTTPTGRLTRQANLDSLQKPHGATSGRASVEDDGPSGPSDPFRDFYFAYKRTTSFTGSNNVDPHLPWPRNLAVRPSIADAPKKRVNVLKWRDEL